MVSRWILGTIIGTLIIAFTSPLFVRSYYLSGRSDSVRGITTLPPDQVYRWRREGWANTYVGPHGMPGRRELPPRDSQRESFALWGDSQAEGVCVADHEKLHASIENVGQAAESDESTWLAPNVLPLGRSGDDAADWVEQFASVESSLDVGTHVVLVAEMSDLAAALIPVQPAKEGLPPESIVAKLIQQLPMFAIHAARMVLTTGENTPRKFRFSLGPVARKPRQDRVDLVSQTDWVEVVQRMTAATDRPILIVYAPAVPNVIGGKIVTVDSHSDAFEAFRKVAISKNLRVFDMRDDFRRSASAGRWPHGFHNGRIGNGHLNAIGYRIIADRIVQGLKETAPHKD